MAKIENSKQATFPYFLEVMKIIEGAVGIDSRKVEAYGRQLADKIAKDGYEDAARSIEDLLASSRVRKLFPAKLSREGRIPVDSESKLPLADEQRYEEGTVKVVIPRQALPLVDEFVSHVGASGKLIAHGVGISPSMLLYGPPGCGKTEIAKYIGSMLDLPVLVARSDSLISSYLGSTSKNIRSLFDYATSHPCILFLDEFDALAKLRDDKNELGELKRVVISLLQNIDAMDGKTVLLAATNHQHLLDEAVWRRFAYKINICLPDEASRLQLFTKYIGSSAHHLQELVAISDGLSGADIRDVTLAAIRASVVKNEINIDEIDLLWRTIFRQHPNTDWNSMNISQKTHALKQINPTIFSNTLISMLLGVSRSYIPKLIRKSESSNI